MMLQVKKRDGSLEEFDNTKIRNAIVNAGATDEEAEHIVPDVAAWAEASAENEVVSSIAIRDEVLKRLREVNPVAATVYEGFQKPVTEA